MDKRHPAPLSSPALPASKVAERLRAHARLCRQIAHESWNETTAIELTRLADQCIEAADNIEPEPGSRLH
jgi:hypothetical protein